MNSVTMAPADIRIVLVEPAGALNVGSVARVMKNMGLRHLVLVNPRCDVASAEARQMAVHAADVLSAADRVATLAEALQGCQRVIATIGRDRAFPIPLEPPHVALPWLLAAGTAALVFGREDRGLTNDELKYAQRLVQIPTNPAYPSLNLAQSVAICCYELVVGRSQLECRTAADESQTSDGTILMPPPLPPPLHVPATPYSSLSKPSTPPSFQSLEGFYQDLETLLLNIGYLYPHTAASRMEKFRWLLNRSSPSEQDVAMLRGILRQLQWALANPAKKPKEHGSNEVG
jgi:tRNA/rRNA methyltransferase